jgi:hypothetical protein
MWRNLFAILFLTMHVNVTMFIAQVDEVDTYNAKGKRQNDINTLGEYIHDVLLHHNNKSRPDEDDDNARYCQIVTMPLYDSHQCKLKASADDLLIENRQEYAFFKVNKWHSPVLDILSPPPKIHC